MQKGIQQRGTMMAATRNRRRIQLIQAAALGNRVVLVCTIAIQFGHVADCEELENPEFITMVGWI